MKNIGGTSEQSVLWEASNRLRMVGDPINVWNESLDLLVEIAKRPELCRSPKFASWVTSLWMLSHPTTPLPAHLSDRAPISPDGIPFLLSSEQGIGYVAFVSMVPTNEQSVPTCELARSCQPVADWLSGRLKGPYLRPHVSCPRAARGRSVALAALIAGVVQRVPQLLAHYSRNPINFVATGSWDEGVANPLVPAAFDTLPIKLNAAKRLGYRTLFLVEGTLLDPSIASDFRVIYLSANPTEAVGQIVEHLFQDLAGSDETDMDLVFSNLRIPAPRGLSIMDRFMARELDGLFTSPEDVAAFMAALQLPLELGAGEDSLSLWEEVLKATLARPEDLPGRHEIAVQALEWFPNAAAPMLKRLAVKAARQRFGELTILPALTMLTTSGVHDVTRGERKRCIDSVAVITATAEKDRAGLIDALVRRRDARLLYYCVMAVTHGWAKEVTVEALRALLHKHWGSHPVPLGCPIHQSRQVPIRPMAAGLEYARDPSHAQRIFMGRYPVTNLDYEFFDPQHERTRFSPHDVSPVVNVSWFDACNYCFWVGLELPSTGEWLSAALRDDSWEQYCDTCRASIHCDYMDSGTRAIDSRSSQESPWGCQDMIGNVWEWTVDWESSIRTRPVVQRTVALGGSWNSSWPEVRSGNQLLLSPERVSPSVGFRCCRRESELGAS